MDCIRAVSESDRDRDCPAAYVLCTCVQPLTALTSFTSWPTAAVLCHLHHKILLFVHSRQELEKAGVSCLSPAPRLCLFVHSLVSCGRPTPVAPSHLHFASDVSPLQCGLAYRMAMSPQNGWSRMPNCSPPTFLHTVVDEYSPIETSSHCCWPGHICPSQYLLVQATML